MQKVWINIDTVLPYQAFYSTSNQVNYNSNACVNNISVRERVNTHYHYPRCLQIMNNFTVLQIRETDKTTPCSGIHKEYAHVMWIYKL